jgi:dTDP-4-amino-4,6-dideoxygalactose transaminase
MNSRLDTLQAAVLLAKLPGFAAEIEARQRVAEYYDRHLPAEVMRPPRIPGCVSSWAYYVVQVADRANFAAALRRDNIPSAVHYPCPMHLQPAYRRYGTGQGSLPVSEKLAAQVLSLPMHPDLDEATGDRICQTAQRYFEANKS